MVAGEGWSVWKLKGAPGATRQPDSDEDLIDTGRCRSTKLCKVADLAVGFRFLEAVFLASVNRSGTRRAVEDAPARPRN